MILKSPFIILTESKRSLAWSKPIMVLAGQAAQKRTAKAEIKIKTRKIQIFRFIWVYFNMFTSREALDGWGWFVKRLKKERG